MVRTLADRDLDAGDRKVLSDIETHGFHIIQVSSHATGHETELAGWAFTVGLTHRFGHPELALFGLPDGFSASVLSDLGQKVVAGERFGAETELDEVIEGYRLAFRPVRPRWYTPFFGYALWFYRGDSFPVLQVHWPDREQRYAWDREEREHESVLQPLLDRKSADEARAIPFLRMLRLTIEEED